jgi:prolipoprotein diacylglyceryl transferase
MILSIHWAVDSQLIDGWRTPNLYGLLFVSGIVMGYFVIRKMFKTEQIEDKVLDTLVTYMVLATILGARLGHVLFYGPYWDKIDHGQIIERGYFSHPGDIIKIWEGGLASHGAAIAILIALFIFSKKISKRPFIWILDRIAAPVAIAATFIRLGNLVNHEMVGYVTDVPWPLATTTPHHATPRNFMKQFATSFLFGSCFTSFGNSKSGSNQVLFLAVS